MPIEKSAGAVIFRKQKGKNLYLLLRYPRGSRTPAPYWDFPKGHVEKGETLEDTVRREVEEETGLKNIGIIPGFKETIKYFFKWNGKNIMKFVTFFIAETKNGQVKISDEHVGFEWLDYEKSLKQLVFKNAKNILKKADDFIFEKGL